jgi:hypothetical protein
MSSSSECFTCSEVITLIYSWAAFHTNSVWVVQHFLNPFLFYMVFQNVGWAIILIFVWESIEVLELTSCDGTACISDPGAGPIPCDQIRGFVTDNMIADISQGFLGILTGLLFRTVLSIPDWTPSIRESFGRDRDYIWLKRLFMFVALFLPSFLGWRTTESGFHYGMILHGAVTAVVLLAFAFWNQTPDERQSFWTLGTFQAELYWTIYGSWIGMVLLFTLTWFLPIDNAYHKIWMVAALVWIGLIIAGSWIGKFAELIDFFSFGLFGMFTRQRTNRFLYDKRRFKEHADGKSWNVQHIKVGE